MTIYKVTTTNFVNNIGAIISSAPTPVKSITEKFFTDKNKAENYRSEQQVAIERLGLLGQLQINLEEVQVTE